MQSLHMPLGFRQSMQDANLITSDPVEDRKFRLADNQNKIDSTRLMFGSL